MAPFHTSREPSPKIEVRMGVDNMVMMVKITATPSVLEEMRDSHVMEVCGGRDEQLFCFVDMLSEKN